MTEFAAVVAMLGALAFTVTKTVDLVRNLLDRGGHAPKYTWNLAAFGVGLAYCLGWQIDASSSIFALAPALAEQSARLEGIAGQVLTGVAIGGLAGFGHELLDMLSGVAARTHGRA